MKPLLILLLAVLELSSALAQETRINLSEFRTIRSSSAIGQSFFLTDPGREGVFVPDPSDRNSADDSVMTLRTPDGVLYKRIVDQGILNVRWFGAVGNGATDDWPALQKAIDYVLNQPFAAGRTLYFPSGSYRISRPLLIARLEGHTYRQSSVNLVGPASSRDLGQGAAILLPAFNNSFAIGIQSGKGVQIKNLVIRGQFTFPNHLTPVQVDTLSFAQWTDGSARQDPRSPYAGIVIDPFSDSAAYRSPSELYPGLHAWCPAGLGRGGSTAVEISGCSILNFVVGVMITPSNQQNGELVDVLDCDISYNKVAYAMGQAQSKECHVERLKVWGGTHTVFDNVHFGFGHGDGAAVPFVDGVNIAEAVKELCAINANSFGGVFRNVYAEQLFRIGFAGGSATLSFEDCQFDFATQAAGLPYPDFFVLGSGASFRNCMLRSYTGGLRMRLVLSGCGDFFEGGLMNEPPVAVNLDNNAIYPSPVFRHVGMYYSDGVLGSGNNTQVSPFSPYPFRGSNGKGADPVYNGNTYYFRDPNYGRDVLYRITYHDNYERTARLTGTPLLHVNYSNWTASFNLSSIAEARVLEPGDLILTDHLPYTDLFMQYSATTYPVGIVSDIDGSTVHLRNLALGIREGMRLNLWLDYYVNNSSPFTGNLAAGDNTIEAVQGAFPAVGERLDIPMLPSGTYVTHINPAAKTISVSTTNTTGQSFTDYTFMNGFPTVDIFSCYDIGTLLADGKTLIGGANFYRFTAQGIYTHDQDFPLNGTVLLPIRIANTHIRGDTTLHRLKLVLPGH
ncbi:MAG TPA: glycosyl hydrolase family 28-related protein [Puia sp.]|nr:glycosyl hydrolase family 28-related protein [Puia sp.]